MVIRRCDHLCQIINPQKNKFFYLNRPGFSKAWKLNYFLFVKQRRYIVVRTSDETWWDLFKFDGSMLYVHLKKSNNGRWTWQTDHKVYFELTDTYV